MSQTMTIKVERKHIDGGLADEPESCPIALAIVEACPWDGVDPHVGHNFASWRDESGERLYDNRMDTLACLFVETFDKEMGDEGDGNLKRFKPFEFKLIGGRRRGNAAKEAGL